MTLFPSLVGFVSGPSAKVTPDGHQVLPTQVLGVWWGAGVCQYVFSKLFGVWFKLHNYHTLILGSKHPPEPQPSARCPFLWPASPGLFPKKKALVPSSLPNCSVAQPAPRTCDCHQASCDSGSGVQSSLYSAVTVPKPWFSWQPILLLVWHGVGVEVWGEGDCPCCLCPSLLLSLISQCPRGGLHLLSPRKEPSGGIYHIY